MALKISDQRWKVAPDDFAARITIPDLKGWFDSLPILGSFPKSRVLVIEPGTRSVIIEDGGVVGELYAGQYTFESFCERLRFWRNKQATVFLTRSEDVPVESRLINLPCLEGVCFDLDFRWTIQMGEVLPFMENLMGASEEVSVQKLEQLLAPSLHQAVRDTIGQLSYDSIVAGGYVSALCDGVRSRIDVKLSRYGLTFVDVQSASAKPQDGGISARQGELWLKTRENQLLRTASTIDNEQVQATAADMLKKVELRVALRASVTEDRLNRVKNKEEFEKGIADIDRDRLLRIEEREALVAAYEERKEDREQLRAHLLATIDLQREQELAELRLAIDHAARMKSLNQEIEQSRLSRTLDSEKWRAELEREREQLNERLAQQHRDVKSRWERIREARQQRRDESWEALLHAQRAESIKTEVELARADRQRQLALVQAELNNRLANEKLEIQKRQELWEIEAREKKSVSQLDRLQRIQEMNAQFAERQQRMQLEIENLKADSASKRELERVQAMSGLGTDVLIATAGEANAALLADLKKHQASQEAVIAQANAVPTEELNAERLKMYELMNATERAKAEAIAEAYRMAMQSQSSNVNQMIGGLAQASTPPQFPIGMAAMMPLAVPPVFGASIMWHVAFDGQQSPPLTWVQVQHYLQSGQINAATMVWKSGMAGWLPAGQIPELAGYFAAQPAPLAGSQVPSGPPPL
jgi:hypothetical protein